MILSPTVVESVLVLQRRIIASRMAWLEYCAAPIEKQDRLHTKRDVALRALDDARNKLEQLLLTGG